jgi:hypothetical protein
MPKLLVGELDPAVVMPLWPAPYCADCEAVFDLLAQARE